VRPDAGTVRVLGLDPVTDRQRVRSRIGMMLQGGGAYPAARVGEMLRLVASYYADPLDPDWLLGELGLSDHVRTPYRRLSGGQQQRLSLAIAVIGRPELVFLDEPTAGLDAQSRRAVWDLVHALRRDGAAVLLTTHLMDEAASLADEVVIVDHGRRVASGSPAELERAGTAEGVTLVVDGEVTPSLLADVLGDEHTVAAGTAAGVLEVHGPVSPALMTAMCAALERAGVQLTSLATRTRSLEEVFLDLTGRDLR
ncbi:MAG: ABC transporter ATP-binding protein, partial [Dietzia sp.]|nr:ABC transporter ATP-binding protein [Dietzia sp.]